MRLTIHDQTSSSPERTEAVRNAVKAYLQRGRDADFQAAELVISIDEFAVRDSLMLATLSVQGQINGKPIDKSFSHMRRDHGIPGVHTGGILGAIVSAAIIGVIESFLWLAKQRSSDVEKNHSLHECVGDIIILLDQHTWQSQSFLARRWQYLQIFKWLASLGMFICLCIFAASRPEEKGERVFMIGFGALCSACLFICIHLLILATMPYTFYKTEPRGIKALTRTGVTHVGAMRAVTLFLLIPFLLFLVFAIWIFALEMTRKN